MFCTFTGTVPLTFTLTVEPVTLTAPVMVVVVGLVTYALTDGVPEMVAVTEDPLTLTVDPVTFQMLPETGVTVVGFTT